MRIAFVVGHFPRLSETFILNQVTGLLERGHEVDIYADQVEDWANVHPDVNRYRLWERTYPMVAVPKNYVWRVLEGLWLGLTHLPRAPRLVLRSLNIFRYGLQAASLWPLYAAVSLKPNPQYDIIHCQFGTQGYRGLALQRLLRPLPKLILMFRGHDISCYVNQGGDRVYRYLLGRVDYCLANCEFFRQRVIELGCEPAQIAVHRSGLDPSKFAFRPRHQPLEGPVNIATVGRLVEKKGIEYAIRAVAQQAARYPDLVYRIVGDGPLRPALEALIHELEAEDYIHLVGWKNEAEIIELLDASHLFIAPSVTAADGNQDAPINVLKEAMAMGLPVLSTFHGGIPELVQDGVSGYLVPERDSEALAARLKDLLDHPERWEAMGQAGRAYVEAHYNIDTLNDRLVQVYEHLMEADS
ncbi:MAG TPA: glycosyltransferase, partial [Trichocoleus sp.]